MKIGEEMNLKAQWYHVREIVSWKIIFHWNVFCYKLALQMSCNPFLIEMHFTILAGSASSAKPNWLVPTQHQL
jgi:hypothetical protein